MAKRLTIAAFCRGVGPRMVTSRIDRIALASNFANSSSRCGFAIPERSMNEFQSFSTQFRLAGRSASTTLPLRAPRTVTRIFESAKFFWYPFDTRW